MPDLSQDVLIVEGRAYLLERSTRSTKVALAPSTPIRGVRLPMAATNIRLDQTWSGWQSSTWADSEGTAGWELAHAEGALTWTNDPQRELLLRLLDAPHIPIASVADATYQSERTLRRRSVGWFGVTPASLRGLLRGWRFLHEVNNGATHTAAAVGAGFADAAHASRDLKRFCGTEVRWSQVRMAD